MKYVGGKHKIGAKIADVLQIVDPKDVNGYLEPFVGSLGVFKFIHKPYKVKIASDKHHSLILLWKAIQNNSFVPPKKITQKMFNDYKHKSEESPLKALIGFGTAFGGDYFSGFIQKYAGSSGRNFYQETLRSIHKMKPVIQSPNVKFYNKPYTFWLNNPKIHKFLIYCDPPYINTTGYSTGSFDHKIFWQHMRSLSTKNYVFISEETAPLDFVPVWSRDKVRTLHPHKNKLFVKKEFLFVKKGSIAHKLILKKTPKGSLAVS